MSNLHPPALLPRPQVKPANVEFDPVLISTLSAMSRFDSVRKAAHARGPDIFAWGAAQLMAVWIVMGKRPRISALGIMELERLDRLRGAVVAESHPTTAEMGSQILDEHTRRNGIPLVISQLDWAKQRLEACDPLSYVRRRLNSAFHIAEGLAVFDPSGGWEVLHGQ